MCAEKPEDELMAPDPQLVRSLISAQERELLVKQAEGERLKEKDRQAHIYAMAALEASKNNASEAQVAAQRVFHWMVVGVIIILVLLLASAVFLVYSGKDAVVMEGIKYFFAFLGGTGTGAFGSHMAKGSKDK